MTYKADRIAWAAEAIAVFQRNSMSGSLHQIHCDVERQHSVEQGCLAIEMMLAEPTLRDLFATVFEQSEPQHWSEDPACIAFEVLSHVPENIAGSGMVQSRVSFSLDCQSTAEIDSDHSTMPISACGHEPSIPADNQTVRNVFVIGPDKKIKLILVYPMTTGRNFDEVLRVIDSVQMTAKHKVATPVNWKQGEDVIIAGSVSDEDAKKTYPQGWKAPKPYIRIVPQPR